MVEIRYGDQYEVSDLAGQTVCEARELFKTDLGIPNKAQARLNGSKVKPSAELDTVLNDDDKLNFAVSKSRVPYLVGALLLALVVLYAGFYGLTEGAERALVVELAALPGRMRGFGPVKVANIAAAQRRSAEIAAANNLKEPYTLYIGQVEYLKSFDGEPLLYFQGRYERL